MPRPKPLLEKTLAMLRKDKRKLPEIAKIAGVNYFWVRSIKNGACKNPRVLHVQALHDALSK